MTISHKEIGLVIFIKVDGQEQKWTAWDDNERPDDQK